MDKQIVRVDRTDYDMYLNGEYVGSRRSYAEAQAELDRLAYDQLAKQPAVQIEEVAA